MSFGDYIRQLRIDMGLTQTEVAEKAEMAIPYLNKIEKNRVPSPSEEILIRLAAALQQDKHEMVVRAGKVPTDFQTVILTDEEAFEYLKAKFQAMTEAEVI